MDFRFYNKKYTMTSKGILSLTNPEPAMQYVETMVGKLLSAKDMLEERTVKLQILHDFTEIYEYDLEHARGFEPFGHFDSPEEKKEFTRKKLLNQDFGLYLGNIFMAFHEQSYRKNKKLPVLRCPFMMIDYNELYDRAICDYIATLMGIIYPFKIIENGQLIHNDGADSKVSGTYRHAVSASYILPSLIEHFLGIYLQNRMLFSGLKQLMQKMGQYDVEMDQEERNILETLMGQPNGHIIFNGSQQYIMGKVYDIFIRTDILKDTEDNLLMFTGKNKKGKKMLGNMLRTVYAKQQIRPEYMTLLIYMFDVKNMNIRNSIMHGSSETMDFLWIGIASVMMQILWDIASEDVFICTTEELVNG